jgi:hypothetical protein
MEENNSQETPPAGDAPGPGPGGVKLDLNRTLSLVRGALLDPEPTWRSYLPEAGDWQKTAGLLTGPLIIAATVVAYLLGLFSGRGMFGLARPTLGSSLMNIIMGAIAAALVAFIVSWLAGAFGGKRSFAHGLAATSLAFVPGYLGQALVPLPIIGGLLSLGLSIYGLVLLWRIIPVYLDVPDGRRVGHFIVSLLASFVAMFIVGGILGGFGPRPGSDFGRTVEGDASGSATGGVFSGMARQGELIAAAEEDTYAPPRDGKLRADQVEEFLRVMERAAEMRASQEQRLQEIAEKADQKDDFSMRDFGDMMSSVTSMAGIQTAEIEVVKSAGGNWAEHEWVREALRTAWVQKDINEAVAHNYSLYQKYQDRLADFMER